MLLAVVSMAFGRDNLRPRVFMTPEEVQAARTREPLTVEQVVI